MNDGYELAGHLEYDETQTETETEVDASLPHARISKRPGPVYDVASYPAAGGADALLHPTPALTSNAYSAFAGGTPSSTTSYGLATDGGFFPSTPDSADSVTSYSKAVYDVARPLHANHSTGTAHGHDHGHGHDHDYDHDDGPNVVSAVVYDEDVQRQPGREAYVLPGDRPTSTIYDVATYSADGNTSAAYLVPTPSHRNPRQHEVGIRPTSENLAHGTRTTYDVANSNNLATEPVAFVESARGHSRKATRRLEHAVPSVITTLDAREYFRATGTWWHADQTRTTAGTGSATTAVTDSAHDSLYDNSDHLGDGGGPSCSSPLSRHPATVLPDSLYDNSDHPGDSDGPSCSSPLSRQPAVVVRRRHGNVGKAPVSRPQTVYDRPHTQRPRTVYDLAESEMGLLTTGVGSGGNMPITTPNPRPRPRTLFLQAGERGEHGAGTEAYVRPRTIFLQGGERGQHGDGGSTDVYTVADSVGGSGTVFELKQPSVRKITKRKNKAPPPQLVHEGTVDTTPPDLPSVQFSSPPPHHMVQGETHGAEVAHTHGHGVRIIGAGGATQAADEHGLYDDINGEDGVADATKACDRSYSDGGGVVADSPKVWYGKAHDDEDYTDQVLAGDTEYMRVGLAPLPASRSRESMSSMSGFLEARTSFSRLFSVDMEPKPLYQPPPSHHGDAADGEYEALVVGLQAAVYTRGGTCANTKHSRGTGLGKTTYITPASVSASKTTDTGTIPCHGTSGHGDGDSAARNVGSTEASTSVEILHAAVYQPSVDNV